jgi:hypothetical protein
MDFISTSTHTYTLPPPGAAERVGQSVRPTFRSLLATGRISERLMSQAGFGDLN